jgi:GTP-binding protein YchF
MQIGIVGLPFSGKSTLFQAITRTHLDQSSLKKREPHLATIKVPDARLEMLSALFKPQKKTQATIEFVDVIGLKKGESGSTQFTTDFLTSVKTNDTLVQVVRQFTNDAVPHPDSTLDAVRDISTFETEFIISDMAIIEGRLEKVRKLLLKWQDETLKKELPVLEKCDRFLQAGEPLREADVTREEVLLLKTYQLLTLKPMLIALNCDETDQKTAEDLVNRVAKSEGRKNTKVLSFFGKIELEISELPEDEGKAFVEEYGIKESALATLIREAYALLGLQSFFTVGEDECRAWTIRRGITAQEAAGVIHSDFVNKFIRAEVVHYDHLMAQGGSLIKAKEAGQWRLEGKEYIVKDGDIISIRHS